MELNLAGKVAVVTGAAGSLGGAVARGFADHGCRVALLDTNEAGIRDAARTSATAAAGRWPSRRTSVRAPP